MAEDQIQREDTMIYRAPTKDTQETTDIWGKNLETRVVDASEVPDMLKDGWVTNPLHIDHPPKPEEAAGFVPDRGEVDALRAQIEEAKERESALAAEIDGLKGDLKAAEDLTASETKAKDEALARVAELEAKAKPTLTVKKES